ncbi:MAG: DNA translocase FtsK [Treponema sp.]|nr:DNA translocase FtsK [Treponema sp.]
MSDDDETISASDEAVADDDEAVTADEAEDVATREAADSEPESEDSDISASSMSADDETMSASNEAITENEAEEPCPEVRVNFSNASVINDNGEQFEIETEVAKEDRNFHIETEDTADEQWQGQTKSEPESEDSGISASSMSDDGETMSAGEETISASDESVTADDESENAAEDVATREAVDSEPESENSDISASSMSADDEPITADEAEDSFSKPLGFENYSAGDDKIDVNIVDDGIDYDDDFEEDVVSESEIETPRTNDYQLTQNEAETESDIEIESDSPAAQNVAAPQSVDTQEEVPPRHTAPVHSWANYSVPTDLLEEYPNNEYWIIDEDTKLAATKLMKTLAEFKIEAEVTGICKGPVVTMFEILPAPGVKLSKIVALQDNIALTLAASSVRIVAPIPGKHAVGIEVPNKNRAIVSFREIIDEDFAAFTKMGIPVVLGKDISGEPQIIDIAKTPHLLIAGSTGAGKSVCVNSILLSILFKRSPAQVKLILVDPKIVELSLYNDIPHLLTPVITEPKRALQALQYCLCEMERRYALLSGMSVRDIISYNYKIQAEHIAAEKLPYIVVIIDEFADLMMTTGKELETSIARLAAKSRAVGIHLVLATQRPSIDVITGLIKANLPSRIAFMVASKMDSRIIIDQGGAEKLLGKGDMLYSGSTSPYPVRIQGTLVSDEEVENVVDYVKSFGEPDYIDDEMFIDDEEEDSDNGTMFHEDGTDPLYDQALEIVIQAGKASASYIQRKLSIGYNRAARLVEEMEERGIVGPANGSKPREIIHLP